MHWRDTGAAVPLLDRRDDGMTLLLRRLRPATTLDGHDYDEQLVVAGNLVARLHAAGAPPQSLPSIGTYLQPYRCVPDPELDRLLTTSDREVAVHADLHGGNVLRDGDRWLAIDPKGVRGDPHLDVWLLLCPQAPPLPDDSPAAELRRRTEAYCDAAQLDRQRATAWVGVIARAEAVLCADSAFPGWVERLQRIAAASRELDA
jgi:streptomycin 6-kinase